MSQEAPKPGTGMSFGPLKQIDASGPGVANGRCKHPQSTEG
jgi:hypothetical protein